VRLLSLFKKVGRRGSKLTLIVVSQCVSTLRLRKTRKPLSELTIAANILKWGTGALNIDGCRVGTEVETWPASRSYAPGQMQPGHNGATQATGKMPPGRWPANVIHDGSEEVVGAFPETQSGLLAKHHSRGNKTETVYGKFARSEQDQDFGNDSGSAGASHDRH
jgi:site-specific DNA-methyltransferase (adenine-specific)